MILFASILSVEVSVGASVFSDKSECLSKDVLTSLGFTDVLDAPADNTASDAVCTYFKKVCVDPAKLKGNIISMLEGFNTKTKANFSSGKGVETKLNNALFKFKKAWADETKKANISKKLDDDQVKVLEELLVKCNDTECDLLGINLDYMSNHRGCFRGMLNLITKALCILASDKGKEAANLDANGAIESIPVQLSEAKTVFDLCVNYFVPQCYLVSLFDIFYKVSKGSKPEKTKRAAKFSETCLMLGDINKCTKDTDDCSSSIKEKFFTTFVSIGKESTPGPESSDVKKNETVADDAGTKAEAGERRRLLEGLSQWRLLESATATCEFTVTLNGWNLSQIESGIDVEEYSGSILWSYTIVSLLISFFV